MSPDLPPPDPNRSRWKLRLAGLTAVAAAALIAFTGIASRQASDAELRVRTERLAVPTVTVSTPAVQPNSGILELPGRLDAYTRAALFARVSGYVSSWKADIGTQVKAGDVLAEIEAPDLDQQLLQAQSDLANAEANAALAHVTNQRYQALLPNSDVTHQAADEKAADLTAKQALVKSAQANVDRLKALSQYKQIVAPFDGIVTVRNTDVGALINSGSTSGSELFVVSDTHKLRLYVSVPQSYVTAITTGTTATLAVPEHPGKKYEAKVEASAGAVDVASGTTRMQLVVDNANGELMPGAYANVRLDLGNKRDVLTVPSSAIIFDKGGLRVATVGAGDQVTLKTITVARDLGKAVEIASGLTIDDRVIENPPDDIDDGDHVKIKAPPAAAPSTPSANLGGSNIKG